MQLNLSQINKLQVQTHRRKLIEQAYQQSKQTQYKMPRKLSSSNSESLSQISNLYDLNQQNSVINRASLLPIRKLIRMNNKINQLNTTNPTTHKATITQIEIDPSKIMSKKNHGLSCTLGKMQSKEYLKVEPLKSWWCCLKQEQFSEMKTQQIYKSKEHHRTASVGLSRCKSRLKKQTLVQQIN